MNQNKDINFFDIFNVSRHDFDALALQIFRFQWNNNNIYRRYCEQFIPNAEVVTKKKEIPFLPVSFFKTHPVTAVQPLPNFYFTSSGTTGMETSRHYVPEISLYEQSFMQTFRLFYGMPDQYSIFCLLPSYLDREGSSLIYMAKQLIAASNNAASGFFLTAKGKLAQQLAEREDAGKKSILLGVSFALLDFAEECPIQLKHTIIIETGGMKGRRREMTRMELHDTLKKAFGIGCIQSEYGMTEMLSQAYAQADGLYKNPPWLKVMVRDEDDPRKVNSTGAGMLCVIDLANVYSCSFIETADVGRVYEDGSFEVLGRMDNSDIRGCSLLVV